MTRIKDKRINFIKRLFIFSIIIFFALSPQAKIKKSAQAPKPEPVVLEIVEQTVPIDGKPAKIFNIQQPNGVFGYVGEKGQMFDVIVKNNTSEWTLLHWQGLIMPNNQDGAPFVTQQPIGPGGEFHYRFPLIQSGTFWMNSHYPSQLQKLMAAPLIVKDPKEKNQDAQDIVMFLQDYEFGDAKEAYAKLRERLLEKTANIQVASQEQTETAPKELAMGSYLTNHRTLDDPDVIQITPGSLVKLRIINASTNSNFFVNLGQLTGRIVATDSEPTAPLEGSKFQLGQGQRLDIEVMIPQGDNAYPILAQAVGTTQQTGLILATPNAVVPKINEIASAPTEDLNYSQELNLRATYPLLPHGVNHTYVININGNLLSYIWTMNREVWPNIKPFPIKLDDRVELVLHNKSSLPIPLHLHGHVFQITEIDGKSLKGSIRDTLLLLPNSTVKVQFDADNPGAWLLRGLVPFQAYGGLGTLINYEGTTIPIFKQKDTGIPPLSLR